MRWLRSRAPAFHIRLGQGRKLMSSTASAKAVVIGMGLHERSSTVEVMAAMSRCWTRLDSTLMLTPSR